MLLRSAKENQAAPAEDPVTPALKTPRAPLTQPIESKIAILIQFLSFIWEVNRRS